MLNVFISGLVKQSGKTLITAGLAGTMQSLGYSTSVYKPIQTGSVVENSTPIFQDLKAVNNFDINVKTSGTYAFKSSLTPLVSAYEDESKIEITEIYKGFQESIQKTECHIVEGSNSIFSPVDEKRTEADIVNLLGLPLVLVVNPKISSLGEVISAINYVMNKQVRLLGIIVNDIDINSENLEEKYFPQLVKEYTNVNILGLIPHYENIKELLPETVIADILNRVEIEKIFSLKIAKLNN